VQSRRRITRDLSDDIRSSGVAMNGVAVNRLANGDVELCANGEVLRLTGAQAWAIAAALLEIKKQP
jgi:hypothetical protein